MLHLLTRHLIGESRKCLDFSTRTVSHVSSSSRLDAPFRRALLPPFFTRISDYSMLDNKSPRSLFRERNRFLFTCSSFDATCQSYLHPRPFRAARAFDLIFPSHFRLLSSTSFFFLSSFLFYLAEQTTLVSLCTCIASRSILMSDSSLSICQKRPSTLRLIGLAICIL